MKNILTSALFMYGCYMASAQLPGAKVFVAPNGNDANPGTLAKPFATLQRAQQQARKAAGREPVTVLIREGTYYLPEPLVITAADAISLQRVAKWQDPAGGFIHALHGAGWGGMHYRITGKGPDNKLTYEGGWQNNRPMDMHSERRFVENIFEELTPPGEWFHNAKTHTLYFYPPAGVDPNTATFEAVRLRQFVELRGTEQAPVRFVSFIGLTFRHAARTFMETRELLLRTDWAIYRGGVLFVNGAEDCALEDCVIDQVGGNAVFVNNYNRRIAVRGCHITQAGGNGVAFIGDPNACYNPVGWDKNNQLDKIDRTVGPKTSNYPADCEVNDCLIHDIGQVEKQVAGVTVDMAKGDPCPALLDL